MKTQLNDILVNCNITSTRGDMDKNIHAIVFDSRKATSDSAFVAIRGVQADGHSYIAAVIENGCSVIISEEVIEVPANCTLIVTPNTSETLAVMATNFYEHPSKKLNLIGITGTNGKTTSTTLLFNLYKKLGFHCGLLSTVVNKIGDRAIASTHTTPDPVSLNQLLAEMVEDGCSHCFMEVSSHAIHQHRITGLEFKGGVFTNITHDHLDYHKTFAEYIHVKKSFFDHLSKDAFALTNSDDKNGSVMLQNTSATKHTYALKTPSEFKGKVIENQFSRC